MGSLFSYMSVKGVEAVGRRVPPERTNVEREAMRMAVKREETWRPINRQRVAAFIRMYLAALVFKENAYRHPGEEKAAAKLLNEALVQ